MQTFLVETSWEKKMANQKGCEGCNLMRTGGRWPCGITWQYNIQILTAHVLPVWLNQSVQLNVK